QGRTSVVAVARWGDRVTTRSGNGAASVRHVIEPGRARKPSPFLPADSAPRSPSGTPRGHVRRWPRGEPRTADRSIDLDRPQVEVDRPKIRGPASQVEPVEG